MNFLSSPIFRSVARMAQTRGFSSSPTRRKFKRDKDLPFGMLKLKRYIHNGQILDIGVEPDLMRQKRGRIQILSVKADYEFEIQYIAVNPHLSLLRSSRRSYKAYLCGLSATLNFFNKHLITSYKTERNVVKNVCMIKGYYNVTLPNLKELRLS